MELSSPNFFKEALLYFLSSVLLVFFLFFIDEGYYNFKWMVSLQNWVAFFIYFVPVVGLQLLFATFIFKKVTGVKKKMLSILCGSILGVTLVISLLLSIR